MKITEKLVPENKYNRLRMASKPVRIWVHYIRKVGIINVC